MRTTSARDSRGKFVSTEQNKIGPPPLGAKGPLSGDERLARAAAWFAWEAHPGQRNLLTLCLPDGTEPQTLIAACGRRWGKTEALAADIAVRFLTEPDLCQMLVGPTRDQATLLFDCVVEKLEAFEAGFGFRFSVLGERAQFAGARGDAATAPIADCGG